MRINRFGLLWILQLIISVNKQESIVAVSLGTRGMALYDISDKENPIEKGRLLNWICL